MTANASKAVPARKATSRRKSTFPLMAASCLALGLALTGCGGADYPVASISDANATIANGYTVAAGDQLKVTVFDEPSLTGEFQVDSAGDLAMPLIEKVAVTGKTPNEVAMLVTSQLKAGGYVLDPKVSVEVMGYRPVYVLGEVGEPGEYPYAPELTIYQAIAKAGGFSPRANKTSVVLQRASWASPRVIKLTGEPLMIAPGDTVIVEESFL
ncbi:polysaccharide biosynthesis/export family protein [Croceicoccus mobilis]|uniref:Sugar ABC transporter substrate-binding protein n=1 Tax=Croceicoccus mobilis TaxID=1703339 RepID=A0A917DUP8_9SPHN|nr:polysaccharide biosynthesis/export family protein [Croceicoccus mobilis]GGD72191.1 sugar ABC transporter substrate-binding protein [Croceicoccus mobilis]